MGLFGGEVGLGAEVEAITAREKGDRECGDLGELRTVGTVGFHEVVWVRLTIPTVPKACCRTAV